MFTPEVLEMNFACVACDATGPAGGLGLQMLLCGAVSVVLLVKIALEDVVRTLSRRDPSGPLAEGEPEGSSDAESWLGR
jgi:hypothetical protein